MENIRLTQYSHGAGCGCKIAPAELEQILAGQPGTEAFSQLLVGNSSKDDAAVWELDNEQLLLSTVDFFLPIVDDPFDFGRIASANAISDIYAMGAKPVFANALLGWPLEKISLATAREVMRGALEICTRAGIPLAGGHSINSSDPIFGLAVNGLMPKAHLKRNNTAQAGDLLYLSKPLGTGIMGTAIKRGLARAEHVAASVELMTTLNSAGSNLARHSWVHAMTDITGFGLLGHLIEMCEGSGLSAQLDFKQVPVLPFLDEYLQQNIIPDNTYRNWNSYEKKVQGITDMRSFQVLNDPQTSGGLLLAVDKDRKEDMEQELKRHGLEIHCIGQITEETTHRVVLR